MNSIIYRFTKAPEQPYNILYFPYDGFFDYVFAQLNVNLLYLIDTLPYNYGGPLHPNMKPFSKKLNLKPSDRPHLIVCNHRSQIESAIQYSNAFSTPIILIDHNVPDTKDYSILQTNKTIESNKNFVVVSINEMVKQRWNTNVESHVINYGFHEVSNQQTKTNEVLLIGDASNEIISALSQMEGTKHLKKFNRFDDALSLIASSFFCVIDNADKTKNSIIEMIVWFLGSVVLTNNPNSEYVISNDHIYTSKLDLIKKIKTIDRTSPFLNPTEESKFLAFSDKWHDLFEHTLTRTFKK